MYYFGCSGWYYWHWSGRFYPAELKPYEWLEHYAKNFNTVEVNSTFYHPVKRSMLLGWKRRVGRGFVFTLKADRRITHVHKFKGTEGLISSFVENADVLDKNLGCILFQLPPSAKKNEEMLGRIVKQIGGIKKAVLEFRHKSWYCNETYKALRDAGITMCIASAPEELGLPEEIVLTSEDAYIRFHGKGRWYSYDYSEEELRRWADEIKKCGARNVYAYFNNDSNAYAVKNCKRLLKLVGQR
ncbi:MAG: DUF72 domain-containing protein [Candidatus Micrarchaeia archaeon]